ncbi:MAG: PorP/SprF family type IX secretion system membrane protein [Bacteroidota bacterium]
MKKGLLLTYLIFLCFIGYSQDIHFSQYYNTPLNINPALTGAFLEDMRFIGNYRSQWQSVPVPYLTFSGSFDMKYFHRKFRNGYFAFGGIFNIDQAGDSELSLTQLNLSGSYTQILSDNAAMSAGFQFGGGQRSFEMDQLRFENQYDGELFNPLLDPRESIQNTNVGFIDVAAGVNVFLKSYDGKSRVNVGVGLFHLNRPRRNFDEEEELRLPMRISLYSFGQRQFSDNMAYLAQVLGQIQGTAAELVLGGGLQYQLNKEKGKELAIQFTTSFRHSFTNLDALIPTFEVHYQSWRMGLSYDINISDFSTATNGQGGPEVSLIYVITKVKPVKTFKACPIF